MKMLLTTTAAAIALTPAIAGCGSSISKPNADKLAASINATFCRDTGYYLENQLDHSKHEVFDCFVNGETKCVDEEGGIARDVTATMKAELATSLDQKAEVPACAQ